MGNILHQRILYQLFCNLDFKWGTFLMRRASLLPFKWSSVHIHAVFLMKNLFLLNKSYRRVTGQFFR